MHIDDKILAGLMTIILSNIIGWNIYIAISINKMKGSIKYLNGNLRMIDWEKVPRKNLNDII